GNEVDEAAMDEMRADAPRALFVEDHRFLLDPGKAANAGSDRDTGAEPLLLAHLGKPGILQRLDGGVDAVEDERIDLALDLVVHSLVRIESPFMVRRLHLAGNLTGIVGGVEARDAGGSALRRENVFPARLDIRTKRRDEAKSG